MLYIKLHVQDYLFDCDALCRTSVECDIPSGTTCDGCNNAARNVGICSVNFKGLFQCSKARRHIHYCNGEYAAHGSAAASVSQ